MLYEPGLWSPKTFQSGLDYGTKIIKFHLPVLKSLVWDKVFPENRTKKLNKNKNLIKAEFLSLVIVADTTQPSFNTRCKWSRKAPTTETFCSFSHPSLTMKTIVGPVTLLRIGSQNHSTYRRFLNVSLVSRPFMILWPSLDFLAKIFSLWLTKPSIISLMWFLDSWASRSDHFLHLSFRLCIVGE